VRTKKFSLPFTLVQMMISGRGAFWRPESTAVLKFCAARTKRSVHKLKSETVALDRAETQEA
jgi:hypothetical protein